MEIAKNIGYAYCELEYLKPMKYAEPTVLLFQQPMA